MPLSSVRLYVCMYVCMYDICMYNVCMYVCMHAFMYLLSTFSNIFSSETTRPIEAKPYVEPLWDGGTKVCSNDPGHMPKMAAILTYGKKLKKSSSPEPKGL